MAVSYDYGACIAMRDDLGAQYMQWLCAVPRGDCMAWMAAGCMAAAEAFAIGVAEWHTSTGEARVRNMPNSAGKGQAGTRDVAFHHRTAIYR